MEPNPPPEELPALYRAILDRVAEMEAAGDRAAAGRVRRAASAAYSRAWDDRARRDLQSLLRSATRPTSSDATPRRGTLAPRRPAVARDR